MGRRALNSYLKYGYIPLEDSVPEAVHTLSLIHICMVTDKTGEPLIGVNVVEKGTTNGVITDFNGQFTLNVAQGNSTQKFSARA